MDSKWAAVLLLLLLLLNWSHTEKAGSWGEDQAFADADSWVPLVYSAPGHGKTYKEPSFPVSAPEVWQKCLGFLEQGAAKSPG